MKILVKTIKTENTKFMYFSTDHPVKKTCFTAFLVVITGLSIYDEVCSACVYCISVKQPQKFLYTCGELRQSFVLTSHFVKDYVIKSYCIINYSIKNYHIKSSDAENDVKAAARHGAVPRSADSGQVPAGVAFHLLIRQRLSIRGTVRVLAERQ